MTAPELPEKRGAQAAACSACAAAAEGLFPSKQETRWPQPPQMTSLEVSPIPFKAKKPSWLPCPNILAVAASETEGEVSRSDAKGNKSTQPLRYIQVEELFHGKNQAGFSKHLKTQVLQRARGIQRGCILRSNLVGLVFNLLRGAIKNKRGRTE